MSNIEQQLKGYRLTTAEILYHMPDHPGLLQTYLWQDYDLMPKYPRLITFLDFWTRELDGVLHSVTLASKRIITPEEINFADGEFLLN